jgi:hypothetical protein
LLAGTVVCSSLIMTAFAHDWRLLARSAVCEPEKVTISAYLSRGTDLLGKRNRPWSALTPLAALSRCDVSAGFSRSAICLFTRSIKAANFFDS